MSQPIELLSLHHVARTTRRLEASIAFYRDLLGFRVLPRPPFSFRGAWLYGGGIQIHLIEAPGGGEPLPIDSRREHIAFRIADTDRALAVLRDAGIEVSERTNAGGIRQLFIRDPDGHQIELAVVPDPQFGYGEGEFAEVASPRG